MLDAKTAMKAEEAFARDWYCFFFFLPNQNSWNPLSLNSISKEESDRMSRPQNLVIFIDSANGVLAQSHAYPHLDWENTCRKKIVVWKRDEAGLQPC